MPSQHIIQIKSHKKNANQKKNLTLLYSLFISILVKKLEKLYNAHNFILKCPTEHQESLKRYYWTDQGCRCEIHARHQINNAIFPQSFYSAIPTLNHPKSKREKKK